MPTAEFKGKKVDFMGCYRPLIRYEHTENLTMNKDGTLSPYSKIYTLERTGYENYEDIPEIKGKWKTQLIPCGKCIGCRLEYSRQWANRGFLESKLHEENYFITLTYDDEHLPMKDFVKVPKQQSELEKKIEGEKFIIYPRTEEWTGTLNKRDVQLFFKRLRKRIGKFSYMCAGEYGEKNGRPHYHAILFGAHFETETFYNSRNINNNFYWQNDVIEECWTEEVGRGAVGAGRSLGFSNISIANWNTIAYTARYITKKQYGKASDEWYASLGRDKEFFVTSRNPAIGKEYFNLHHMEIMEKDKVLIHNINGSYEVTRPRYFDKLIEKYHEEELTEDKERRQYYATKAAEVKDWTTSLSRKEQLEVEERSKIENSKQLLRPLEKEPTLNHGEEWRKTERPRPRKEQNWLYQKEKR